MIGIALTNLGYDPRDAWWGVPRFGAVELPVVTKHFRELREVYGCSKALGNGDCVVVQSIGGKLHAIRKPMVQIPKESSCVGAHALRRLAAIVQKFGIR